MEYVGEYVTPSEEFLQYEVTASLGSQLKNGAIGEQQIPFNRDFCPVSISVYPTKEFYDSHVTNEPLILTVSVIAVFFFTGAVFLIYNYLVERRNTAVVKTATDTQAIVSNIFPKGFRDRLVQQQSQSGTNLVAPKHGIKSFLEAPKSGSGDNSTPLAELFLNTTVMFADVSGEYIVKKSDQRRIILRTETNICKIAGFTAWSSVRSPAQVFTLLETIYQVRKRFARDHSVTARCS